MCIPGRLVITFLPSKLLPPTFLVNSMSRPTASILELPSSILRLVPLSTLDVIARVCCAVLDTRGAGLVLPPPTAVDGRVPSGVNAQQIAVSSSQL